tara:strand:- start:588 stop:1043 length:456 start_codon:yes stop_codon:yes gene_type:complete
MSNLFYKDPLKAAYMAREFGVEFANSSRDIHEDCQRTLEFLWGKTILSGELKVLNSQIYKRYLIHPDSLDIFKPMVGDVTYNDSCAQVVVSDETWTQYCKKSDETRKLDEDCKYNSEFEVCTTVSIDNVLLDEGEIIIQRNGKQFFSPEGI